MRALIEQIRGSEVLTNIFGGWPSFHDANLLSIELSAGEPSLSMKIHLFQCTNEVDERGYYIQGNHTVTIIGFSYVVLEFIKDFNEGNIISDLQINDIATDPLDVDTLRQCGLRDSRFHVRLSSSYGCTAAFGCRNITVLAAEPFVERSAA
jgi:hypothetical protein